MEPTGEVGDVPELMTSWFSYDGPSRRLEDLDVGQLLPRPQLALGADRWKFEAVLLVRERKSELEGSLEPALSLSHRSIRVLVGIALSQLHPELSWFYNPGPEPPGLGRTAGDVSVYYLGRHLYQRCKKMQWAKPSRSVQSRTLSEVSEAVLHEREAPASLLYASSSWSSLMREVPGIPQAAGTKRSRDASDRTSSNRTRRATTPLCPGTPHAGCPGFPGFRCPRSLLQEIQAVTDDEDSVDRYITEVHRLLSAFLQPVLTPPVPYCATPPTSPGDPTC